MTLRQIGAYRLPAGATAATVDGLGRVTVFDGDGSAPEHVAGPDTVNWK